MAFQLGGVFLRGNEPVRRGFHSAFLYHACKAGMDMGIVNAAQVEEDVYENIDKELLEYIEDVLLNRCSNATERCFRSVATLDPKSGPCNLRRKGQAGGAAKKKDNGKAWRNENVGKRLEYASCMVSMSSASPDTTRKSAERLDSFASCLEIIEGPLMDGMNVVEDFWCRENVFACK